MHFSREKYFQILKDIPAEARTVPGWADYAACENYERGLRREAFNILERFTSSMGRYVRNQPDKGDGAAKRLVGAPPRAHGIYFNLVPFLRLRNMEALYLAGEGNSRIDVNVM